MRHNDAKRTPNQPDWICNQDNGRCGSPSKTGAWFPTSSWDEGFATNVATVKKGYQSKPMYPAKDNVTVPPEVWEAKDRMNSMQSAVAAASRVHEGTGNTKAALADSLEFYELVRAAKNGGVFPNVGRVPQSEVGKKIAQALDEPPFIN
jgi:hypothetical protein